MFLKLFLAFTLIPIIEIYILMKLGVLFGVGTTLFIVIGTGLLGASLARQEGYRILLRMRTEMNAGRVPAADMIDAFLVFIAGVLLITPGVLTDILGFLILFPPTRILFKRFILRKVRDIMTHNTYHVHINDQTHFE